MQKDSLAILGVLILGVLLPGVAGAESIWVEGESSTEKSTQRNGWYESVKRSSLSGNSWLGHFGKSVGTASYTFSVEKADNFALWWRINPVKNNTRFRIDDGEWQEINMSKRVDQINLATDGKPDLRFIGWVNSGMQSLKAGEHQITIEFRASGNHHHGAIDCFCLTTDRSFKPLKTLKPGEEKPFWPAPKITEANLDKWLKFIEPTSDELGWRSLRWHSHLSDAAQEARDLNRPILLWAMNGHPCGET